MLKLLRKKGVAKKVIWFIAIIIIISFGFLGTAYLITGNMQANYAGKIFNKRVEIDDFQKMYTHVVIQAQMKYGEKFSEIRQFLDLEAETWDRLILLNEVTKRKIKVEDQKVVQAIEGLPFFQREGQFDTLLYNDILRFAFRISPRDFEESMRDTLKFSQLFEKITKGIVVNEDDIFEEYKKINEKIKVSYVVFEPKAFLSEVTYDEEKAKIYFQENESKFILPPSINISYLEIDLPEDDEEAEEEESMETDESSESDAMTQQEIARQKAQLLYEELLINPNINEVAQENALAVKETGLFSAEDPELPEGWSFDILAQSFKLSEEQIAGPFESNNKLFVIQIKEKQESILPTFEEASEKVKESFLLEEALIVARKKALGYLPPLTNTKESSFEETTKNLSLEIFQTPSFNRGQYLPKIGVSADFQESAFKLSMDNPTSAVVETDIGPAILHLDEYIPVTNDDYEIQRQDIAGKLLNEKRNETFTNYLSQLRIESGLEDNISKLRGEQSQPEVF